jgi:hypothetical protein
MKEIRYFVSASANSILIEYKDEYYPFLLNGNTDPISMVKDFLEYHDEYSSDSGWVVDDGYIELDIDYNKIRLMML